MRLLSFSAWASEEEEEKIIIPLLSISSSQVLTASLPSAMISCHLYLVAIKERKEVIRVDGEVECKTLNNLCRGLVMKISLNQKKILKEISTY